MSRKLETYARKRDFERTPEPATDADAPTSGFFVVQKHAARRLHFDFRLAIDGVLKSWAVPKGPSLDPEDKRLAIQTEDHPLAYGDFEGTIPKGQYGGGTVQLWDRGGFTTSGDPAKALSRGKLHFELEGEKLRGGFDLFRLRRGDDANQWLLRKSADAEARDNDGDATAATLDYSVASGQSLAELGTGRESSANDRVYDPQLAQLAERVPRGKDWAYEVKWDGYRLLVHRDARGVRMLTRQGKDWTERFRALLPGFEVLAGEDWVLDGEAVVLDEKGRSDFGALQRVLKEGKGGRLYYMAFDLLRKEGEDLRSRPLHVRKDVLEKWIHASGDPPRLRYSQHFAGGGARLFETACQNALEGLVAKRLDAPYRAGRQSTWRKIKCVRRQEFVVVGFTAPQGSRKDLGALLLATREGERWHYRGKTGTGFGREQLRTVREALEPLRRERPVDLEGDFPTRDARWVEPRLLAEVSYAELTSAGRVRHAVFQGLREDKPAAAVRLETAAAAPPPRKRTKMRSSSKAPSLTLAGISISHPERVIDPVSGATKGDLAGYYEAIGPAMVPYLHERPLSVVRCPQGGSKACFFQKHFEDAPPPHTHAVDLSEKSGSGRYSYVTTTAGIVALAQYGVIELHGWGSRMDRPDVPDQLIFDLDPHEAVEWKTVLGTAFLLHDMLQEVKLRSFLKWTGGKGLHVCVPLTRRVAWDAARPFAKAVAQALVQHNPRKLIATASKAARTGKVFIDYLRNGPGATAVIPFSARARPGLPVALPLSWEDPPRARPEWTIADAVERVRAQEADPWSAYLTTRQSLTKQALEAFGIRP